MSSLCVKVWAQLDLKATDDTLRKTFSPEELGLFLQKLRPEMLCALQERSSSTTFLLGWLSRSSGGTSGSGQVYWSDCCLLVSLFSISRTTWSGTCRGTPTDRGSSRLRGIFLYLGGATILLSRQWRSWQRWRDDENYNDGLGVHNNHRDLLSNFDDDVTTLRWDEVEAPVEVDEAKADEVEEGEEGDERKGKSKKRLSQKSSGDWARE